MTKCLCLDEYGTLTVRNSPKEVWSDSEIVIFRSDDVLIMKLVKSAYLGIERESLVRLYSALGIAHVAGEIEGPIARGFVYEGNLSLMARDAGDLFVSIGNQGREGLLFALNDALGTDFWVDAENALEYDTDCKVKITIERGGYIYGRNV